MAANPVFGAARSGAQLRAFRPEWAPLIARWCRDPQQAFWLAPRTQPPITALQVSHWEAPGRSRFGLVGAAPDEDALLAYGEVNVLNHARRDYWLGHLVVDPRLRGRGFGKGLTVALLTHAFQTLRARSVSLVVFRENEAAIRCYEGVGMRYDGTETHYFPPYRRTDTLPRHPHPQQRIRPPYRRTDTLLRMGMTRKRWQRDAARYVR